MSFCGKILSMLFGDDDKPTRCCYKCKHLFFWNDGSAGCDIEKEDFCIPNDFILWEGSNADAT